MQRSTATGKAVYFLYYAAAASLLPVLTLHYQREGLAGGQIGLLAAVWPAASIVGASIWGAVADATGRHKLVLLLAAGAAAASAQLLRLGAGFWSLLPIVTLFAFVSSPVIPLVDNAVLDLLGSAQERYGRVRLWGAAGWGLSAPLAGLLMDRAGLPVSFPIYSGLMVLTVGSVLFLPVHGIRGRVDVRAGLRLMAADPRWLLFLVMAVTCGAGSGFVHHYLFIYLDRIGGSGLLRGVALAVATTSELVVFALAERIVRRLGSRRVLLLALGATAVRLLLFSVITVPLLALLPQLLHGVTFSLFLVGGVTYARQIAPTGMGATAQSIFTSTHMGIGGVVGALAGGVLYQAVGISGMFLTTAALMTAGFALFAIALRDRRPMRGGPRR